jgi:ADP-heptose:LPS heptosyltransferase
MGKTSLLQMAEMIRRSQLFIGGCSAPLHMAAALHTPFVAFYGATLPEHWAPRTKGITLNRKLDCSPCNGPMIGCEEKTCMYEITVEKALEACQKMLGDQN